MKYRSIRRWGAEMRLIARVLTGELWRRHRVSACLDCLSGKECRVIRTTLEQADVMRHTRG